MRSVSIRRQSVKRRCSPASELRKSIAAVAAAAIPGGVALEKMNERARLTSHSIRLRDPQTNPPLTPSALLNAPI